MVFAKNENSIPKKIIKTNQNVFTMKIAKINKRHKESTKILLKVKNKNIVYFNELKIHKDFQATKITDKTRVNKSIRNISLLSEISQTYNFLQIFF